MGVGGRWTPLRQRPVGPPGNSLARLADTGLRLVQPWVELRIGVLTALIGAPFFVWLVLKTRSELAP